MLPTDATFRGIAIAEIKTLEDRLAALNIQRESIVRELDAWRVLYKAKTGDKSGQSDNGSVNSAAAGTEKTPTAVARELVGNSGSKGIKPKDLTQAVRKLGYSVSNGFASNLLYKMKQDKEVIGYRKRYYLLRFAPAGSPKPAD
jgi:hypothetical protein